MNFMSYCRRYAVVLALAFLCSEAGADETSQSIQQNIDELIRSNSCVGCDLRGADLNRMILTDADLSNADLSGATFYLADLSGANLSGANLREAKFGGADLAGADLRGADLRGALLDGAFLKGSLMDGKVVEATAAGATSEVEAPEKVYVPDETKPKEVMDQNQAAVSKPTETVEASIPQQDDSGKDSRSSEADEVVEKKKEVTTGGAAPAAVSAPTSQPTAEEMPKKAVDQKKRTLPEEVAVTVPAIQPGDAPPVKKTAPVQAAQVGSTPQSVTPQAEVAEVVSEAAAHTSKADLQKKEPVGTAPVDNNAAARQGADSNPEAAVTSAIAMQELVEKLLDTNSCYECDLSGVDLSGEDLSGFDLEGADLSGAILNDTDLAGTNLKGVSLQGAQMRNADLRRADLYKANLSGADLTDADFRGALTDEADFSGVIGYQPSLMVE